MDPPDGPLAPLPGAEALFRVLPPKSTPRSDIEGIYSADFMDRPLAATLSKKV